MTMDKTAGYKGVASTAETGVVDQDEGTNGDAPDGQVTLGAAARAPWGKADFEGEGSWLPLYVHMYDSFRVAGRLWDTWVPAHVKGLISNELGGGEALAKSLVLFLSAVHDIGKATPSFQMTVCYSTDGERHLFTWKDERAGLEFPAFIQLNKAPRHTVAGQVILEQTIAKSFGMMPLTVRSLTSIVGCHHGTPPDSSKLEDASDNHSLGIGLERKEWRHVRCELIRYCSLLSGLGFEEFARLASRYVSPSVTSVISGLVIMVDWIASNQNAFPLIPMMQGGEGVRFAVGDTICFDALSRRFDEAWESLDIPSCWEAPPIDGMGTQELYGRRFSLPVGSEPRPVQVAALDVAEDASDPGLMIIEAPMGEGKTEAALAAAEVFAGRLGCGGVCVALPTMATTDAMFGRVHDWVGCLPEMSGTRSHDMYLAHGKARLNEEFMGIARAGRYGSVGQDLEGVEGGDGVYICDWMFGRKRGMLANFVVCTVDQVLMGALQMKHLALRQLALANKVVIIDECHAYDVYMRQYLDRALEWMGSWGLPVVLLSATLPEEQRAEMVRAYLCGKQSMREDDLATVAAYEARTTSATQNPFVHSRAKAAKQPAATPNPTDAYPLLTYTTGCEVAYRTVSASGRRTEVRLQMMPDALDELVALLHEKLADGGCVGVICDTVDRAQEVYRELARCFGDTCVFLTHARFVDMDRMENEKVIRETLGPGATLENGRRPSLSIVVGTQVLEQSLDIDFDVLVSDVAPVDLLFQRLGRVHRHRRTCRPDALAKATCYVRGVDFWEDDGPRFSKGIATVYKEASLLESCAVLELVSEGVGATVDLPRDIARLVRLAYRRDAREAIPIPAAWDERYKESCEARAVQTECEIGRSRFCLLQSEAKMHRNRHTLTGWYSAQRMVSDSGSSRDADRGPRAVRDTQETVEVMVLCLRNGKVHLLPWVGDADGGVRSGCEIPNDVIPPAGIARVAAQCTVRLPLAMCPLDKIDHLIDKLEKLDGPYVGAWQESPWLEGQLAILLEEDEGGALSTTLCGWKLTYSREIGLEGRKIDDPLNRNSS
ncbi:MAG: CRISPR-associated helicase Cas3' [Acidobacteriota bacterium]|nr:CRISPR-associated helicase Cas3' [Acidobacteriota bacterium]